uniref:glycosyltransferase n=1 Tax=uncultured Dysgonomonas sp. TaxID=206096 RepID=UPI00261377A9|nr:glycosyltransferase [uncultured Dysgonomonas sp.]
MKIFQVITVSEFGGAQSVVSNLIEGLSDKDEVFILYGGNGEAWKHLEHKVHLIKLCEHRKEVSYKDLFLAFKLFRLRLKYQPDVVHLHSSKMGAIGRIVFNPKTIVYTVHGFDSIRKAFRKFLIIEKMLKNRAARIVGVSKYDVDCLYEEGISRNVELVYNGIVDHTGDDLSFLENMALKEKIEVLKCNYTHIVMCISRISPQKKFDLFLEIARVKPNYAFVWIGNKEVLTDLPSNVFCLGETHSAYIYLKYADIFILPSNYEGLPISLLEALSFGIPVVASDVGGIGEVLNGNNGFVVANDVESFVSKIDYILQDSVNSQVKINARESYLRNFTINKMVEGYTSIFKAIYNKGNR